MKKWKLTLIMGVMVCICVGCGGKEAGRAGTAADDSTIETQVENEPTADVAQEKNNSFEELEEKGELGENAAFAEQIREAFADKDMEALADLCAYPLAVNGEVVEDREAFLALEADAVFTEKRCAVIEAADDSTMEETMAGIIMGDSTPNVIFKSVDRKLGITGIN